jgi:hypothetical protein
MVVGGVVFVVGLVVMGIAEAREAAEGEERILPTLLTAAGAVLALVGGIFRGALSYIVAREGGWQFGTTPKERLYRIATFLSIAMIGVGLLAASIAIPLTVVLLPDDEDVALRISLAALLAPIALGLAGGATAGAVILGGRRAAWIGLAFAAGFGLLVTAIIFAEWLWAVLGVGALAVSGGGYYALGTRTGTLPAAYRRLGRPIALVFGVGIALVGLVTAGWPLLLFGAMMVAAFVGMRIGTRGAEPPAG